MLVQANDPDDRVPLPSIPWPIWAPSWARGGDSQQEEAVDRLAKDLERESGDLDENLLQAPRADYNWHGCRMSWI